MIEEIKVRTALTPSRLPGLDYALNPYRGCAHACVYCYAPSLLRWDGGKWGELVKVKVNLPRILSKELRTEKKGVVGLGTVTDPYQPAEERFEITRRCLELLLMHDFPVCIQTKSSLVLRDMEILGKFSHVEVGITLTALDDTVRNRLEPGASSVRERLRALEELRENGIDTWVFLGPVIPHIADIEGLIDAIAAVKPNYVLVDRLRLKKGVKECIMELDPSLLHEYHYGEIFEPILRMCHERGLKCEINKLFERNS